MLKETEKKQDFFVTFLSLVAFRLGGPGLLPPLPGYAYDCITSMIFVILRFCMLFCLFALVCMSNCQSDTKGSVLYDHSKYVCYIVGKS